MGVSVGMPGNQLYITFHYKGAESHPELSVCATGWRNIPLWLHLWARLLKIVTSQATEIFFCLFVVVVLAFECKNYHCRDTYK